MSLSKTQIFFLESGNYVKTTRFFSWFQDKCRNLMLRVALKKLARKLVRKKVKKFAFDHCKTCSERFVIWRDNFSFIFQGKEDKEMSEKRCYTVQELQEILGVSRPTIYNLYAQAIPSLSQAQRIKQLSKEKQLSLYWSFGKVGNGNERRMYYM